MSKFHSGDSLDKSVGGSYSHSDSEGDEQESHDQNSENDSAANDGCGHTATDTDSDQEVSMFADHVRFLCQYSTEIYYL